MIKKIIFGVLAIGGLILLKGAVENLNGSIEEDTTPTTQEEENPFEDSDFFEEEGDVEEEEDDLFEADEDEEDGDTIKDFIIRIPDTEEFQFLSPGEIRVTEAEVIARDDNNLTIEIGDVEELASLWNQIYDYVIGKVEGFEELFSVRFYMKPEEDVDDYYTLQKVFIIPAIHLKADAADAETILVHYIDDTYQMRTELKLDSVEDDGTEVYWVNVPNDSSLGKRIITGTGETFTGKYSIRAYLIEEDKEDGEDEDNDIFVLVGVRILSERAFYPDLNLYGEDVEEHTEGEEEIESPVPDQPDVAKNPGDLIRGPGGVIIGRILETEDGPEGD